MNEFFKIDKRITDASDNALKLCKKQFEYIETFYNTRRIHSHCGMLSPDEFEKKFKKYSA